MPGTKQYAMLFASDNSADRDVFHVTGGERVFALSVVYPPSKIWVFRNGVLMEDGVDYSISGNTLQFTGQSLGAGDSVQVRYS